MVAERTALMQCVFGCSQARWTEQGRRQNIRRSWSEARRWVEARWQSGHIKWVINALQARWKICYHQILLIGMRSRKTITQAEIARRVGVSQSAVSAVLSGLNTVSIGDETRARVLELAGQFGYVRRKVTAKLTGGRGKESVLIVESPPISPPNELWLENAYQTLMGKILTASSRYLHQYGASSSLFYLNESKDLMQWLADSNISGVLWHANESDSALLHWVADRFPLVLLNRQWNGDVAFDCASIDQEKNISVAAEHLWKLGHRRICTFGHSPDKSIARRRITAYRTFVAEKGLRNYHEFQEISDDAEIATLHKVRAILDVWKRLGSEAPTALITSDVFALFLLKEARASDVRVPEDLSIVGIDNTAPAMLMDPPLSSMDEPFDEMCRVAVELLMRRKANPDGPSQTVQVAPRLVVRQSVKSLLGTDVVAPSTSFPAPVFAGAS